MVCLKGKSIFETITPSENSKHNSHEKSGTVGLWLWCLMSLSTIFQLYCGGQFYWWRKPQGRIQDFKLWGAHLKKLRRAEGGPKIFGVFRVKNHDFTPKNHIFPILGEAREISGVFHVKNHDFMPKKSYFFQF